MHQNAEDGGQQNQPLRNSGVMVVGMGMKAHDIQKASDLASGGIPRMITCVVCKGAKKRGRKQKNCKTCKGTGLLSVEKFQGLLEMVRGEITVCLERSMRDVMLNLGGGQQVAQSKGDSSQ